jgi:hypothetical protein|tara:strand:- start:665 stop:865 length:201 start_codon:yes stop_codon:yes gene_type:complete
MSKQESDLQIIRRRKKEDAFAEKQVEELHAAGVTSIINAYGTDDIDRIDRLWWSILTKMIDRYQIK